MWDPPDRATKKQKPDRTQNAREGTRSIVGGWLTTAADYVGGRKKEKSYDDFGFRRTRAREIPKVPREEYSHPSWGSPDVSLAQPWLYQHMSREPSMEITPPGSPRTMILFHDSERLSNSDPNDDGLQRSAVGEPSRAYLGDSHVNPARKPNGTWKPQTVNIWLTPAVR